jgi:hypothetical protein
MIPGKLLESVVSISTLFRWARAECWSAMIRRVFRILKDGWPENGWW